MFNIQYTQHPKWSSPPQTFQPLNVNQLTSKLKQSYKDWSVLFLTKQTWRNPSSLILLYLVYFLTYWTGRVVYLLQGVETIVISSLYVSSMVTTFILLWTVSTRKLAKLLWKLNSEMFSTCHSMRGDISTTWGLFI